MTNKIKLQQRKKELFERHSNFFTSSNTTVDNFIYEKNGDILLREGMIPNIEIWEDIKRTLEIKDSPCEETYSKK
jgi:hypothetical protein